MYAGVAIARDADKGKAAAASSAAVRITKPAMYII
jgi:hypothetical protein